MSTASPTPSHTPSKPSNARLEEAQGEANSSSSYHKPQEGESSDEDNEEQKDESEETHTQAANSEAAWWRVAAAEIFGTFVLTFGVCGVVMITELGRLIPLEKTDYMARAVFPGLLIVGIIYAVGDVSGAHVNPVATWAFVLRGTLPWKRIPLYWFSQVAGAIGAALLLRVLFGNIKNLGVGEPHIAAWPAVAVEALLTGLLIFVILNTARRHSSLGPQSALAVGSTVAACRIFGAPLTGCSMNPARSLGPAIVTGQWAQCWIYIVGPFLGASLAAALMWLLHGAPEPEEAKPAAGDEQSQG